jgi:hypothetical protein
MILDDIGRPRPADVAKCLGVSRRTMERWIKNDKMPRTAHLALFWITRWGMSSVDAEATNQARMYAGLAACRSAEVTTLQQTIERLLMLADFGCANDPAIHWRTSSEQPPSSRGKNCSSQPNRDPSIDTPSPAPPLFQSTPDRVRIDVIGCNAMAGHIKDSWPRSHATHFALQGTNPP